MELDRFRYLEFDEDGCAPSVAQPASDSTEAAPSPQHASEKEVALRVVETVGEPGRRAGQFLLPRGLALDADGALYVADSGNCRVQRIALNGDVVLYEGFLEPYAVAVHPQTEALFVADLGDHRVYGLNRQGERFQVLSGFFNPQAIACDKEGYLWVADTGNARIARFQPQTGACVAVIGREVGQVHPVSLAFDPEGVLHVADDHLGTILRLTSHQPPISLFRGVYRLGAPAQFAFDLQRRLYLADPNGNRLFVFNALGEALGLLQKLPNKLGGLRAPFGVVFDALSHSIYLSDTQNHRLLRILPQSH